MSLTLFFLAASLACLVYGVADRLPLPLPLPAEPPPHLRRPWFYPLELLLQRDLDKAQWQLPAKHLIHTMLAAGALGALLSAHFHNLLLIVTCAITFGMAPYQFVRISIRRRSRTIYAAALPALIQIAKLSEVRHHPFLALSDALPMLELPLRAEFERAIAETQAGLPLPEALRQLATRCCDNFYLHQLAELVAIHIRAGGDLSGSLQRLVNHLRTMRELRAEESAELFGYTWLTRILFGAALLPLPYWALTGSQSLRLFQEEPLAQWILVWVVLSGLAIASLPYWIAIEE